VSDLRTTLISAGAGAIAGFVVNLFSTRWTRWRLYRGFQVEPLGRVGSRACVRVHNRYIFPISCAYAYITIDHEISDVLDPPDRFVAFVTPLSCSRVTEDRLCWSVTSPQSNPPSVDIYAGERQALDIVNFGPGWLEFPSEKGWASLGGERTSRVFLRSKRYRATIKIVTKDTKAREFRIEIDPDKVESAIRLV
jgi:hypothetical protein